LTAFGDAYYESLERIIPTSRNLVTSQKLNNLLQNPSTYGNQIPLIQRWYRCCLYSRTMWVFIIQLLRTYISCLMLHSRLFWIVQYLFRLALGDKFVYYIFHLVSLSTFERPQSCLNIVVL